MIYTYVHMCVNIYIHFYKTLLIKFLFQFIQIYNSGLMTKPTGFLRVPPLKGVGQLSDFSLF